MPASFQMELVHPKLFFFSCSGDHRDLHSFPTRRSSDLPVRGSGKSTWRYRASSASRKGEPSKCAPKRLTDRKSTRLNSSHQIISYAVFCLKKKKTKQCATHRHARTARSAQTRPHLTQNT